MRCSSRCVAFLSAAALLLASCASSDDSAEAPPIGGEQPGEDNDLEPVGNEPDEDEDSEESEEPAEPEEAEDPYAVPEDPDDIDEEYAKLVIDTLLEIQFEALVTALSQERGHLEPEAFQQLTSISDGRDLESSLDEFQEFARADDPPEGLLPVEDMKATSFEPARVLHAEPERCMMIAGWWDQRSTAANPNPEDTYVVFSLSLANPDMVDETINPTPWVLRQVAFLEDTEGAPIPEEEWDNLHFGDAVDNTCEHLE